MLLQPSLHGLLFHFLPAALLAASLAAMALRRIPLRLALPFMALALVGIWEMLGTDLALAAARQARVPILERIWDWGAALGRLDSLFLVLFAHAVHRTRASRFAAAAWTLIALAATATPFFVYSIIPELVDILSNIYVLSYWLILYLARGRLGLDTGTMGLLRPLLGCALLFVLILLVETLGKIPELSPSFSILVVDFRPLYLLALALALLTSAPPSGRNRRAPPPALWTPFPDSDLSPREREVLALVLEGESNASIAERLFISESTVKKHVNSLFRKLKVGSRWELLRRAGRIHPNAQGEG